MLKNTLPRRRLLATAGAAPLLAIGRHGWAAATGGSKRLVVVFLRGAVDGLNVIVPYGDAAYHAARPSIAIAAPGGEGGALDLDGQFGLHPALAPLMPFWQERSLAFVHASGSPDPSRSHFDAQDFMETGTPGRRATPDGWMNRLAAVLPRPRSSTQSLSFGPTLPRIFAGTEAVANVPLGRAASRPIALDRPIISAAFDRMYVGDDAVARAYREGVSAHKKVLADLKEEMMEADNGAPSPLGFSDDVRKLTQLVSRDPSVDLAFFALGGWDTHVNQGGAQGQLANRLRPLGEGLAALATGLGPAFADTLIVVMSEFGRTVAENGNRGTDHGHGNAMWLLGGPVAGGRVHGDWPGLGREALYEGRDLAITTDFRTVIGGILTDHIGLSAADIARVLPAAPPAVAPAVIRA